jgi:hypothetical protein
VGFGSTVVQTLRRISPMSDEDDDEEDDHGMPWEEEAEEAVQHALETAEVDDVRGTVTIYSAEDRREDAEFDSFDKLQQHLIELYNVRWYANVPFDGGEAVFEDDAGGYVGDVLAETDFEEFFLEITEPEDGQKIISSDQLVATPADSKIIRLQLGIVSAELAEYFLKDPQKLREMDPEDFEKLMAAVFKNQGFDVTRTPFSKDGGVDLILVKKSSVGSLMTLVDCKRYAQKNKVGVDVVRGLYGVVEQRKATSGMIVTTSSFTKGAVDFRNTLEYRMELADLERIKTFLAQWRR